MRGYLLVLGAGRHQAPLIKKAEAMGFRTVIADNAPGSPGRAHCTVETNISALDVDGCLQIAKEYQVEGIITAGTDQPVRVMAQLSHKLGLPCYLSPEGAEIATNKTLQRKAMDAAGVRQPAYKKVSETGPFDEWETFPCVVKPSDSQGQRGVNLVRSYSELAGTIDSALQFSASKSVIIEEFIEGQEFTVNAWIRDGEIAFLAVSDRITYSKGCLGVCFQHIFPSIAAAGWEDEIRDATLRISGVYGVRNGPLYIQMIASPNGPVLVEAAARIGGGHEAILFPHIASFNPYEALLGMFTGGTEMWKKNIDSELSGLVNFVFADAGKCSSVQEMDIAKAEGIVDGGFYIRPGDSLSGMIDGQGRVGYFLAVGKNREKLEANAESFYCRLYAADNDGENLVFLPKPQELMRPEILR